MFLFRVEQYTTITSSQSGINNFQFPEWLVNGKIIY